MARDRYAPKKPIYKRVWFWILVVLLFIGSRVSSPSEPAEDHTGNVPRSDVEYIDVTVDELFDEFRANELRANDEYLDAYVSITGRLRVIDDEGKYFGIYPLGYETLDGVKCDITHDDQVEKLKEYSKDDTITVKGKITEAGGLYGETIKLEVDCID